MISLFQPLKIKEITFRNRIAVSPMCQYSSIDGFSNDWHLVHLGSRAVGGAALVISEATAVSPEGRISPEDLGIWSDEHVPGLRRITDFIHSEGSVAGIQLAHAGRKASTNAPWKERQRLTEENGGWKTFAPSAVAFSETYPDPKELSLEEIEKVVLHFKNAAKRSVRAGFKVVEIHAAHGYLIHEFLSPLSNFRNDTYGGSFENRIKILLEIIEAVKKVWPSGYPLFVRISATDWTEGGWAIDDSVKLASILLEAGVDLIDCSTGGNVAHARIPVAPGYQVRFAEAIKSETNILTAAVGLINTAIQAEEIISSGKADMVFLAREMLRDPYFPQKAAKELGYDLEWPVQYERAK